MARKKLQYQSTSNTFFVAPIVAAPINVFSSFSQPLPITRVAAHQQPQVTFEVGRVILAVTPATLVFTRFSEPAVHSGTQSYIDVDVSNSSFVPVAPVTQISVFTKFSQPQTFKTVQDTAFDGWSALPPVTAVVQNYVFSPFEQPRLSKAIQDTAFDGYSLVQPILVNVFSPFSQPSPTRPIQDTAFDGYSFVTFAQAIQPYVFSKFEQPQIRRIQQVDSVEFSLQPFIVVTPPVFTGFSDFGLPQQLIGTQRKQDGSSVDFRVLQPPFVPSVVQFGGWYDFGVIPKSTAFNAYEQPQVNYEILVPIILFPDFATGGGKRWQDGYKKEDSKEPKVLQLQSSNLKEMSYDEDQKRLKLVFKTYEYEKVPKKKVELLSHGKYFQKHIRDQYPTTKVPPKGKK